MPVWQSKPGDCIVKTGLVTLIWLLSTLDSAGFLDSRLGCGRAEEVF